MPCTDCTRSKAEFGCLKDLMQGWFTVVNDKLSGLEDGQKLLLSRFDKQDEVSAKGGKDEVASFTVDRNIVQNSSSFAAILPVESTVNEDENAIIPTSTSNGAWNPDPMAASANNVTLNPEVDQRQITTQDFSASENLDNFQISFSLVEPQPSSSVHSQYISSANANIDEQQSGVKTEPLLQQSTDERANVSSSSGLLDFQNNSSPYGNVHNILNESDAAPYLHDSFIHAENLTVTNKGNVAGKQLQSNSMETALKTQRRFSKRHDGKKVVYTDREAKRSKTEETDIAINKETYIRCLCPISDKNKCNRSHFGKGEKHFQCGHCKKKFSRKFHLVNHVRLHTGEYPYQCNYCKKRYALKTSLVHHVRWHTGEKPFQCNYCEKKFSRKLSLVGHERFHTGEKPFQCNYCKNKFSQSGHLTSHIRSHTGETPYQCNYCEKKFARKDRLVNHVRVHTGGKPYQCNCCEERFSQKAHLVAHEDLQHTGE